jgi:hypothetical protein
MHLKKLGFLRPKDIQDESSSVLVDNALKTQHLPIPKDVTFDQQNRNQQEYEAKKGVLQKGMYVMLIAKETPFDKSFDIAVSFGQNHKTK